MKHIKRLQKTTLTPNERTHMRTELTRFIQDHPLPVRIDEPARHIWQRYTLIPIIIHRHPMFASITLAIILALGGGTVAAAEQAAPGNALYPVKVHVNESVRGALAIGTDKEAAWQTKKAERRLVEAAKLAAHGTLSPEKQTDLINKFNTHTERTKTLVTKLEEKGNAEAAANIRAALEARLEAFDDLVDTLKTNSPDAAEKMKELHEKTKAEKEIIKDTLKEHRREDRSTADDMSTSTPKPEKPLAAAEGKLKATEHKLADIKNYFSEHETEFSAEAAAKGKNVLADADKMVADAKILLSAQKTNDAFGLLQKAHVAAERAKNLLHHDRDFRKEQLKKKIDRIKETRDDRKYRDGDRNEDIDKHEQEDKTEKEDEAAS